MLDYNTASFEEIKADILEDGIIDESEVTKIKTRLYADGVIDKEEANFLFELNDAASGNENHSSWQEFFVEALTDHVLKDDETPGVIDEDEANYLIEKISSDGKVDQIELNLLINICDKATGESPDIFNSFVLESLKDSIIEDGLVDANEVQMMKTVIYGTGGKSGASVDRQEADFIFDINDATTDNEGHDDSWKDFFVESIAKHLLEDEESPGAIDENEGDWLISRIEGDGEYDSNEKALLKHLKEKTTSIAGKLKFKIDMFAG